MLLGNVELPDGPSDVSASGSYAYVVASWSVQVIDISNPWNPRIIGQIPTETGATSVEAAGPYLYVADRKYGLEGYDISNFQAPQSLGGVPTEWLLTSFMATGSRAFLEQGIIQGIPAGSS